MSSDVHGCMKTTYLNLQGINIAELEGYYSIIQDFRLRQVAKSRVPVTKSAKTT
jgi:hypothetical protein